MSLQAWSTGSRGVVVAISAILLTSACAFDDISETGYLENQGKSDKDKPPSGFEKTGGDREAIALTDDRRLGFLRNPIAGSDEYTFELISDHGFDDPDDPILWYDFHAVASHPTDLDIVYVQTHHNKYWLKIFEVNIATLEVTEVFSREDIGYQWGTGMGTDCDGNLYLTRITDSADVTAGQILRLDLDQTSPDYVEVNSWSYIQQPPFSFRPAYTDLVGDFDGSVWGMGGQLAQVVGDNATMPVTAMWSPASQLEEPYTLGVALSREYLAEGEVQEFILVSDDFNGYDTDVFMVHPGQEPPLVQVGRHVHGVVPGNRITDLASLPGWCLCGGEVKEALDDANDALNELLNELFYLDWDIRNARYGSDPFAILIEAGVLAFTGEYECPDEATLGGLEDCYSDLEAERDTLLETIDELEEILEDRGCDLGDF